MVEVNNPDASEKVSEETAGEEETMDGSAKSKVSGAAASAREKVSEATAGAKRKLNQAKEKYGSVKDKVSSTDYREATSDLRGYVQAHPGKAIVIAAGVGFLVGLLLRSSEE